MLNAGLHELLAPPDLPLRLTGCELALFSALVLAKPCTFSCNCAGWSAGGLAVVVVSVCVCVWQAMFVWTDAIEGIHWQNAGTHWQTLLSTTRPDPEMAQTIAEHSDEEL